MGSSSAHTSVRSEPLSATAGATPLVVADLFVYPVKSCGGIRLSEATVTRRGLAGDREWMVVDPGGEFVTQRTLPRLALIAVRREGDGVVLSAPGRAELRVGATSAPREAREVRVWKHGCRAWDEGQAAAEWLTSWLERPVRLVRFPAEHRRLSDPRWTGEIEAENAFSDGFPILVIAEESVADLNARLGGEALPMNRFRPNLVLCGAGAYAEDRLRVLRGGGVELRLVKPCTRCRITTTDQATAEVGIEPLRTLATYRRDEALGGVTFGQNAIVAAGEGQVLRVGMPLTGQPTWNVS